MQTDPHALVDAERGLVSRRIFIEPEIYEAELARIFARCWLFLCHDSQVRGPAISSPPIWAKTRCWWCATAAGRCTPFSTSAGTAATGCAGPTAATPPASPAPITAGPTAMTGGLSAYPI